MYRKYLFYVELMGAENKNKKQMLKLNYHDANHNQTNYVVAN